MALEVRVPAVGESVKEARILKWHKKSGDYVEMDQVLVELETDKATVEVVSEGAGVIQLVKNEGDIAAVGDVMARIETSAAKPASAPAAAEAKPAPSVTPPPPAPIASSRQASPTPATTSDIPLSPAVRRMVTEQGVDPQSLTGTGKDGRITKGDVIAQSSGSASKPAAPSAPKAPTTIPTFTPPPPGSRQERRVPMSMLRRKVAERLMFAQNNAAILTTFNEIDMSAVMKLREQYKEKFKEKYGVSLGFMSFFVKSAIEALKAYPAINGWIEGSDIVYHDYYDIGVAVSSDRGLVVPVVRDADRLGFAEMELAIGSYGKKARDGKITMDDLAGGTFTVSNGGVFGSLMSTPILNPPQSGILGMHKIEERPKVVDGQIVIRPLMYVALSYDHRIVDGKEAVQFLVKIKECVEDPTRLMLGV